jgi:tripartite-type tricarboxylate transporter receptor subunit TctC
MTHIPFKGGGESVASTLAGQTSIIFTSIPSVVQHIKAGKLVGLGVSSRARDPSLPDVPTINESAVPGYEFTDYMGVVAPAGTPREAIARLQQAFAKALADPEVHARIAAVGAVTVGGTPEELGAFLHKDLATWQTVVKATGIHAN